MFKHNFIICLICLLSYSCTYDKAELKVDCVLPATVSFSHDIQPIFNAHCNTAGCHSGSSPQGGLK